jgi:hypothetical protein
LNGQVREWRREDRCSVQSHSRRVDAEHVVPAAAVNDPFCTVAVLVSMSPGVTVKTVLADSEPVRSSV